MTEFLQIHHASVVVENSRRALEFYIDVLGMQLDPSRPDLGFPGAWLRVGDQLVATNDTQVQGDGHDYTRMLWAYRRACSSSVSGASATSVRRS